MIWILLGIAFCLAFVAVSAILYAYELGHARGWEDCRRDIRMNEYAQADVEASSRMMGAYEREIMKDKPLHYWRGFDE